MILTKTKIRVAINFEDGLGIQQHGTDGQARLQKMVGASGERLP
jgi:hypothetical protein